MTHSRLYKSSDRRRYISMTAIIATNVGFFYHGFTPKSCSHFYDVAPAFKAIQMMVSQAILGMRTYNIAQRNVWVARTVVSTYFIAVVFEWFAAVGYRIPRMTDGNCTAASIHPLWPISTWSFYLVAMLYDCLMLSISSYYLLKLRLAQVSAASGLVTMHVTLLGHRFLANFFPPAVNVMNIVFYRSANGAIQSSGCSLGKALTWIMSQRILIHVRARPPSWHVMSPALLSEETKRERRFNQDQTIGSSYDSVDTAIDRGTQVCTHGSVFVETKLADEESIERGIYASPESTLDRGYAIYVQWVLETTRAGCSYLKQTCMEEFDLYCEFFSSGKEELYQYLETLCDYLYDDLRPRILHEPRLTVLCEVCTALPALMVLDQSLDDEIEEDGEKNDELGRLHIRQLLQMVLQDAQTRLFFKAQAVIQSEIRYYTPTAQDLAYPDKLVVQPVIFYDLAHEAVNLCHASLLGTADSVGTKSASDGQLFLVCHLFILREITRNLDLAQKDEPQGGGGSGGADQYGVADTLASVLSRTSTLLPGLLFTSLADTRAEHLTDAERPLCAPLRAFTGRPASAAEAAVLDEAFRSACARDLRAGIARVRLYVPDARTAGVLVQHALDHVEDAYSAFSLAARQVGARAGKGQDCSPPPAQA
ncbi:hypothetical protein BJV78DRAFT_1157900 [Lactifluus subvellereus]|nr:hypothetical protein BJV78DRAFT_1157900 [Lactifluus subvellereus]